VDYHKPQVEDDSFLDNRRVVPCKHTDISGVSTASTTRAMTEAMRTSETSVYTNNTTRHYSREGCRLETCYREDVVSQGTSSRAVAATKLGCHGNKNLQGKSNFRSIDRKVDGSIVSKQYARFSHNSS
jgi:hypothetical protein